MGSKERDAFEPELDQAQKELADALSEACRADVKRANTGELIRIEEVLAIANEAAKTAVSIRRRRSRNLNQVAADAAPSVASPDPAEAADTDDSSDAERIRPTSALLDLEPPAGHRAFHDRAGTSWEAFAVYPSAQTTSRARLPGPFRNGWLAFECDREKRRLSPIPDGWQSLAEPDLLALCERAEPVRRRTPPDERPTTNG